MELNSQHHEVERQANLTVAVPAVETLLDPVESTRIWDSGVATQVERHAERSRLYEELFASLPNPTTSLKAAVEHGLITADLASEVYSELANILSDPEYNRILLYLPFEFLPSASWSPEDSYLSMTVQRFKHAYRQAWYDLLTIHDVRANFVDGDVIEIEQRQGDMPRVVKAAHLTPALLERGIVSLEEAEELLEATRDPILHRSIREALTAYGVRTELDGSDSREDDELVATPPNIKISKGRQDWLEQREKESEIITKAQKISSYILAGDLKPTSIGWMPGKDETGYRAIAEGIYKAIETSAWSSLDHATDLYSQYGPMLENLWFKSDSPEVKEQITRAYRRLYRLGLIDQDELGQLGIDLPTLSGPFSENLAFLPEDADRLKHISGTIAVTPGLKNVVYPVVLLNGSRLKGYGSQTSDVDTSIFMRPGADETNKEHIRALIQPLFKGEGYDYKPMEFWLQEQNESLRVRKLLGFDSHVADDYWAHTLLGSAWIGDEAEIQRIQQSLLPTYFEDSKKVIYGRKARSLYIEELERDRLQYRLLQKGYSRHYPQYPREAWTHQPEIDGEADFWDPGYRQLATQIYVNSVFLPKTTK